VDLRDRGYLIGGGPLVDQDDDRLVHLDHGRLAVEVMTWMVPEGNVRFENVPAPRSMAEAAGEETR
jgi:hypothetical protein